VWMIRMVNHDFTLYLSLQFKYMIFRIFTWYDPCKDKWKR